MRVNARPYVASLELNIGVSVSEFILRLWRAFLKNKLQSCQCFASHLYESFVVCPKLNPFVSFWRDVIFCIVLFITIQHRPRGSLYFIQSPRQNKIFRLWCQIVDERYYWFKWFLLSLFDSAGKLHTSDSEKFFSSRILMLWTCWGLSFLPIRKFALRSMK